MLEVTKRNIISRSEIEATVASIATRLRARLLRVINDAPSALLGLNEADIHRVLEEKVTFALNNLALPDDFFEPKKG